MSKLLRTLCLCTALVVTFVPWASAIGPVGPAFPTNPGPVQQTYTCYQASIILDYDCDGTGDVGWNEGVSSFNGCLNRVAEMALEAQRNGYCYRYNATPNCTSYTSNSPCQSQSSAS